jgi:hypothetical protein
MNSGIGRFVQIKVLAIQELMIADLMKKFPLMKMDILLFLLVDLKTNQETQLRNVVMHGYLWQMTGMEFMIMMFQ